MTTKDELFRHKQRASGVLGRNQTHLNKVKARNECFRICGWKRKHYGSMRDRVECEKRKHNEDFFCLLCRRIFPAFNYLSQATCLIPAPPAHSLCKFSLLEQIKKNFFETFLCRLLGSLFELLMFPFSRHLIVSACLPSLFDPSTDNCESSRDFWATDDPVKWQTIKSVFTLQASPAHARKRSDSFECCHGKFSVSPTRRFTDRVI